jgi:hypothetical protein
MRRILTLALAALLLVFGACGDDDDSDDTSAETSDDSGEDTSSDGGDDGSTEDGDDGDASGPAGDGELVLDGEEISLGPGLCFLEPQDAAAGGGEILATAQAQGTNAAGEEVRIDFSRYSEDSQFAGDDVNIDIGPLGESSGYSGNAPEGTVSIDGSTVSAADFTFRISDTGEEVTGSFTINC